MLHTARFGDTGEDLVGFRMCKLFEEGDVYEGTIISILANPKSAGGGVLYQVQYDDGDAEDLTLQEMVDAHNEATQ